METQKNLLKSHIKNSALSEEDKKGFVDFIDLASANAVFKLMSLIPSASSKNIGPVWKSIKNKAGLMKSISSSGFLREEQKKQLKDLVLEMKGGDSRGFTAEEASDKTEKIRNGLNGFLQEVRIKTHHYLGRKIELSDKNKMDELRKSLESI